MAPAEGLGGEERHPCGAGGDVAIGTGCVAVGIGCCRVPGGRGGAAGWGPQLGAGLIGTGGDRAVPP